MIYFKDIQIYNKITVRKNYKSVPVKKFSSIHRSCMSSHYLTLIIEGLLFMSQTKVFYLLFVQRFSIIMGLGFSNIFLNWLPLISHWIFPRSRCFSWGMFLTIFHTLKLFYRRSIYLSEKLLNVNIFFLWH